MAFSNQFYESKCFVAANLVLQNCIYQLLKGDLGMWNIVIIPDESFVLQNTAVHR